MGIRRSGTVILLVVLQAALAHEESGAARRHHGIALIRDAATVGLREAAASTAERARQKMLQDQLSAAMTQLYLNNVQRAINHFVDAPAPSPAPMEFGALESFGREDTAKELTEAAVQETDKMVDQMERAVGAETRRAVFRSLTRLRGAAISSFDGMAHSQAKNIDDYTHSNRYRDTHEIKHLAEQESNYEEWAFPGGDAGAPAGAAGAQAPATAVEATEAAEGSATFVAGRPHHIRHRHHHSHRFQFLDAYPLMNTSQ